jgi:hypothetical protein
MNPWRAYLLLLQDFARWTGTHGGMISSNLHGDEIPQMDVVTSAKGKEDIRDLHQEERRTLPLETPWHLK